MMIMMMRMMMSHEIPDMVIIVCNLIKWFISTGANIDSRKWLKVTASLGYELIIITYAFPQKESVSQIH